MNIDNSLDLNIKATVAQRQGIGYALVESDLSVITTNDVFICWIEHPPASSKSQAVSLVGQPLPHLFPELVGLEETLEQIARTQNGTLAIPKIYRRDLAGSFASDDFGYYFDMHIEPLPEVNRLLIIIVDVTQEARLEHELRQERNELRINALEYHQTKLAYQEMRSELEQQVKEQTLTLIRTNTLVTTLNQVAIKIDRNPTPEDVMKTLGLELKNLDITCFIAFLDSEVGAFVLQYVSIESKILKLAQKLVGFTLQGFHLTADNFPPYSNVLHHRQTVFETNLAANIKTHTLPHLPQTITKPLFQLVGVSAKTSAIHLPLIIDGRIFGVLGLWGNSLQKTDESIFSVFASQVAASLRNTQLYQAVQLEAKNLATVLDASKIISSSLDLETVLQHIAEQIVEAMDVADCVISRWDQEADTVITWVDSYTSQTKQIDSIGAVYALDDYPATRLVLENCQTLNIVASDPLADPAEVAILKQIGAKSSLMLPIVIGDQVIGLVEMAESRYEREFAAAEIELCQALISQAAIAIKNAMLLAETEQQLKHQLTLQAAAKLITSTLDLVTILNRLTEFLTNAVNVTSAYICGYEPDKYTTTVLAEWFSPQASLSEQESDLGEMYDLSGSGAAHIDAFITHEPVIINITDENLSNIDRQHMQEYGAKSILILPLITRNQLIAYVELWESRHHRVFTPNEIELSQAIAQYAAIAIENARLFEAISESESRYRLVSELTTDFAYAVRFTQVGPVFEWITDAFQTITGFTMAEMTAGDIGWRKIVEPKDVPIVVKQVQNIAKGQSEVSEFRIITKDRQTRWLRNYSRPEWDAAQNKIIRYYGAAQDVTVSKQAEEKLYQQTANIKALHDIDRAILAAESSAEIAQSALNYVRKLVPCIRAGVLLFDFEAGHAISLAASVAGETQLGAGLQIPLHSFDLSRLRQGQHELVEDLPARTNRTAIEQQLLAEGINSYLSLPLIYRQELIGRFNIGADYAYAFTDEHVEIVQGIANQLAIAIQNRRLFEQAQEQLKALTLLVEANATISTILDVDELLKISFKEIADYMEIDDITITRWHKEQDTLVTLLNYTTTDSEVEPVGTVHPLANDPTCQQVLTQLRPQVVRIADPEIHSTDLTLLQNWGYSTLLMLPLVVRDQAIGLLELMTLEDRLFSVTEIGWYQTLANQVAAALENAWLFEQVQQYAETLEQQVAERTTQLQRVNLDLQREITERKKAEKSLRNLAQQRRRLLQLSQAILSTLSLDKVVEQVQQTFQQIFPDTTFGFYWLDQNTRRLRPSFLEMDNMPQILRNWSIPQQKGIINNLVETGQAKMVNNAHLDPRSIYPTDANIEREHLIVVPIEVRAEIIGTFLVGRFVDPPFNDEDFDTVQLFTIQISIALENIYLFDETFRRTQQLTFLNELAGKLTGLTEASNLCRATAQHLVSSMGYFNVSIFTVDPANQHQLVMQAVSGEYAAIFERSEYRQAVGQGVIGRVAEIGQTFIVNNTQKHSDFFELENMNICSEIATPLKVDGLLIGVLNVESDQPNSFDASDVAMLTTVADQLAVALEKARLFAETRQWVSQLEALRQASLSLTASLELPEVLNAILRVTFDLVALDEAYIFLYADDNLTFGASMGTGELGRQPFLDSHQDSFPYAVVRQREATIIPNMQESPLLVMAPTGSIAGFPLKIGQRIVGVMNVARAEVGDFSEADLRLLHLLADQAAITIENARLYQQVQQELTERQRAEEALRESEEILRTTIASMDEMIFILDRDGRYLDYYQPPNRGELYLSPNEFLGKSFKEIMPSPIVEALDTAISTAISSGRVQQFDYCLEISEQQVWFSCNVSTRLDSNGRFAGVTCVARNITERKQAEQQLYHAAFHDALTQLPNRDLLGQHLEQVLELAQKDVSYLFALLFIDLDRFKFINDSLGHLAGDQILVTTARRLSACVRSSDLVVRLGGDEFAVLLKNLENSNEAQKIAQRIQQEISKPIAIKGKSVFTTVSIGITVNNITAYEQPEDLLRDADAAMYQAKFSGKARYTMFEIGLRSKAMTKLTLENELRLAIEHKKFELYYQPIVSITTGQITGLESLLRWPHPEQGFLPASEFLPVVEETGMIISLGEWVLRTACSQAQLWYTAGYDSLRVAVNVSVYQLQQPDFAKIVKSILNESNLRPALLELEITESIAFQDIESSQQVLQELTNIGVQISIDDFGTGHSSLSYLRHIPSQTLKIDQVFIKSMLDNHRDQAIVAGLIALGRNLGMKVVAEGVETQQEVDFLHNHQCDEIQGYIVSPPLPATQITSFLNNRVVAN